MDAAELDGSGNSWDGQILEEDGTWRPALKGWSKGGATFCSLSCLHQSKYHVLHHDRSFHQIRCPVLPYWVLWVLRSGDHALWGELSTIS
ncbi:hypothetical protein DPEC_G00107490 [Dallia pectoralis]|uniref:Uncharacterized protein n=1 Tax=Dallia pectoralis TaxID=75939 RepID=A0ACC2GSQ8_DALPE|nr:hypothetical protein DPEC_G00107490 [Dallia pectoralis]